MAIWETSSMDVGLVNTLPNVPVVPAGVVTTAVNNTGTLTGAMRVIAGAAEDIEYGVDSPPYQINGTTPATGSLVVTVNYYQDDGVTLVDSNTFPAQQCSATVNGALVGTLVPYRTALPFGATKAQVVIAITGVCGQLLAGYVLGGHRKNRAV